MVSGLSHRWCDSFSYSEYSAYLCGKRVDERTRTAFLLITSLLARVLGCPDASGFRHVYAVFRFVEVYRCPLRTNVYQPGCGNYWCALVGFGRPKSELPISVTLSEPGIDGSLQVSVVKRAATSQQVGSRGVLGEGRCADHAGVGAQGCLLNFDQISARRKGAQVYLLTGAL
jgi:hypothetical protein